MTIDETGGRRVKSVQVIRQGMAKTISWFRENRYKLFEVINQREGGFDVNLEPCGAPGMMGYVADHEVRLVEFHDCQCVGQLSTE